MYLLTLGEGSHSNCSWLLYTPLSSSHSSISCLLYLPETFAQESKGWRQSSSFPSSICMRLMARNAARIAMPTFLAYLGYACLRASRSLTHGCPFRVNISSFLIL